MAFGLPMTHTAWGFPGRSSASSKDGTTPFPFRAKLSTQLSVRYVGRELVLVAIASGGAVDIHESLPVDVELAIRRTGVVVEHVLGGSALRRRCNEIDVI